MTSEEILQQIRNMLVQLNGGTLSEQDARALEFAETQDLEFQRRMMENVYLSYKTWKN